MHVTRKNVIEYLRLQLLKVSLLRLLSVAYSLSVSYIWHCCLSIALGYHSEEPAGSLE